MRIVIKIGTSTLTYAGGRVNLRRIETLCKIVSDMMNAAEIIVTSSGTLCRPVCEIDGIKVGGRSPKILKALQDALLGDFMCFTEE